MKLLRKKRVFAFLFIGVIVLLFLQEDRLGRWMYPVAYEQEILISAAQQGVDPILIAAIIRVESNFRPDRVSRKNAVGLMQLMPDTAEWIVRQANYADITLERLKREDVNILLGAWYLRYLYRLFEPYASERTAKDAMAVVTAAYNAGPGNVERWLREGTWDGTYGNAKHIPFGETRHYVQRVLYYYEKYSSLYAEKWELALRE